MARERYRVTKRDRAMVASYVERKLATDEYWVESAEAVEEFREASRDEVALNGWCALQAEICTMRPTKSKL
jgi:hypothetical protein